MGLDMYLYGEKQVSSHWDDNPVKEDGFVLEQKTLSIGYWRKHPNLHGFIVDTFAGEDNCQPIFLSKDCIEQIINALETDEIYKDGPVTGFFFGQSYFPGHALYEQQKIEDIEIFRNALNWLEKSKEADDLRYVYYRASW